MQKYLNQGSKLLQKSAETVAKNFDASVEIVKEWVGELPVFVSLERSTKCNVQYDEKHYFVIPYKLSPTGFSLHTMRYLPTGAPEVNDLPKRRIFHFPNELYEGTLRVHLLKSAKDIVVEKAEKRVTSLDKLADDIDALDSKLTYGMLFVGGVTALVNPLIGATIAAKALLPSATGLLSKYGIRAASEKLKDAKLKQDIQHAQRKVLHDFSNSDTLKLINPILAELELALNTTEQQHDPLFDPNIVANSASGPLDEHWRELTERAVYHIYKDVYEDQSMHQSAKLGPEDVRWLKVLFATMECSK